MEDKMKEVVLKAETLIEALPYIRDFNGKKVVVKYGGSAMLDEKLQESVIKDVALLKLVGMQPIIVHGGGKEISKWLGYMGKESEFVEGLRVTDADTIEVAEMVLNKVNKHLVQMMEKLGVKAAGISGKDGGLLKVEKKLLKILFRLLRRLVWMKIIRHITLMRMMRQVQLQSVFMQKNWHL